MAKAVNLTEHQVRHRREKPKYARFLQEVRERRKSLSKALIPRNMASSCTPATVPTEVSPHGQEQLVDPKTYAEKVRSPLRDAEPASEGPPPMTPPQQLTPGRMSTPWSLLQLAE